MPTSGGGDSPRMNYQDIRPEIMKQDANRQLIDV